LCADEESRAYLASGSWHRWLRNCTDKSLSHSSSRFSRNGKDSIKTYKSFKTTLFNRTKTQFANFRGNPLYQATKRHLTMKKRCSTKTLTAFGVAMLSKSGRTFLGLSTLVLCARWEEGPRLVLMSMAATHDTDFVNFCLWLELNGCLDPPSVTFYFVLH